MKSVRVGHLQEDDARFPPYVAAAAAKAHKESSTIQWKEVEATCGAQHFFVSRIHPLTFRLVNMKLITAIYLNCRPDLRDEWLTATEIDDINDAVAQETMLRQLVKFCAFLTWCGVSLAKQILAR